MIHYSEIYIGGTVSTDQDYKIREAIKIDCDGWETIKVARMLKAERSGICEFDSTRLLCKEFKLPCEVHTKRQDEDEELSTYGRDGTELGSYFLGSDGVPNILAEPFNLLRMVLKEVDRKSAPNYISEGGMYEDYAKHLLARKSVKDFVLKVLDEYVPPPISDLPPYIVYETKGYLHE